jgi:phosphoglycerate dehydrogenase-like enzyme
MTSAETSSVPATTGPVRVAVLDDYQAVASRIGPWSQLTGVDVAYFGEQAGDEDALIARLEPFEIVVAMRERTPFPRAVLERLSNLRLLVTTGMMNASIDLDAAREHGVVVTGTGSTEEPTAELTWGLILGLVRHIAEEDRAVRRGVWQHTLGGDLAGATLGILGLGRLGRQVARIGLAFGMEVVAWSQNLDPRIAAEHGVTATTKEALFRRADVVTIHLKLSDRTRGLVSAEDLERMKPSAYLVNTSRGPIVDEDALVDALSAGRIAGAGLDVFDIEPLPAGHRLLETPHTLLTPHLGYVTSATYEIFFRDTVEDIAAYLAGAPVRVLNA